LSDSSPANLLSVQIKDHVGALALDVTFALTQPWTVLFGPSGSGKTTILRTIAGFVRPSSGRITRGDSILLDSEAKVLIPAHRRPVRSAGQVARLFPHMTVQQNLSYGVGSSSRASDTKHLIDEVLTLFQLGALAARMPRNLSGGERQRVSVARAVASAVTAGSTPAAILLLDEPFAGLDNQMRDELLVALREWLAPRKTPVLAVTHDVGEAFQLGAEVLRIADGRIVAQGPAATVLAADRTRLLQQLELP
jgi:molybdate transport system ATP-binding protein